MIRIGVDTGGTFTDLVLFGPTGLVVHKVRSTPDDPSRAILEGIDQVLAKVATPAGSRDVAAPRRGERTETGVAPPNHQVPRERLDVVHGSTVATNAVLERRGARVALVATAGFEDVLRIGRQTRRELYNFFVEDRRPLVGEDLTFGVRERMDADGTVLVALDERVLASIGSALRERGVDSAAVCLLHSYVNPVHERRIAEALSAAGVAVSVSHEILPEYREFERWSTTAVNAYVSPLMDRYLDRLERGLAGARVSVMQSNGGSISASRARAAAVQTILSGPAAGAVGAHAVATAAGCSRVITLDMGGTSTDVSLIDGVIGMTTESVVGDCPVRLPMIDIHTVGAGGGSIAFVDAGGALRVGPRSAGADPGPACYGAGVEMTVTDANLLLGRLDPETFFGGRMKLDVERARSCARDLARGLDVGEIELAMGIVRVANANMERAVRVVSVQRGFDPRGFVLLAFGGAGGMHACDLADALDIPTVLVPRHAGVLSALGMLLADVTRDYSQSVLRPTAEIDDLWLHERFGPIVERARRDLAGEGFGPDRQQLVLSLDVRYVGQSFEIGIPLGPRYREEFDRLHERRYGYADPARAAEVVNLRVRASGVTQKPSLPEAEANGRAAVPLRHQTAWLGGRRVEAAVHRVEDLVAGATIDGPAIVAGGEATTVVTPDRRASVDALGNLVVSRVPRTHRPRRAR